MAQVTFLFRICIFNNAIRIRNLFGDKSNRLLYLKKVVRLFLHLLYYRKVLNDRN